MTESVSNDQGSWELTTAVQCTRRGTPSSHLADGPQVQCSAVQYLADEVDDDRASRETLHGLVGVPELNVCEGGRGAREEEGGGG